MAFLFFLGIVIMAGIIFMAVSKKSAFKVRIAALGALALMIASVIICLVVYFKDASKPKQVFMPDMLPSEMPAPTSASPVTTIMLIIFMIVLFAVIFFMAMREQKRAGGSKKEETGDDW